MDFSSFLKAIPSVTDPLTLIAFIVVVLLAILIAVLKYTKGLDKALELLLRDGSFSKGEVVKVIGYVLITLVTIAILLFGYMAYSAYLNNTDSSDNQISCANLVKDTGNIEINNGIVDNGSILNTGCLNINQGDSPEEKQKKIEQAKRIIASEVLNNISNVNARLGYLETSLTDDNFDEKLKDIRKRVAPASEEDFSEVYDKILGQQQVSSLRSVFSSNPLNTQYGEALIKILQDGKVNPEPVRAFYNNIIEVQYTSESLLNALSEGESKGSENQKIIAYYERSTNLEIERLKNRSQIAHLSGLLVLNRLNIKLKNIDTELATFEYLEPRKLINTSQLEKLLTQRTQEAGKLLKERIALVEETKELRDKMLEDYGKISKKLEINPSDPWNVVVAKAIILRRFGRTVESVSAFARYRDMFAATDPTAEQYSHTAQQFTTRIKALGVKGGIYIFKLVNGGAASKANLAIGDIVVNYNGQTIEKMNDLVSVRENAPENVPLKITYLRMDKEGRFTHHTATVKNPMGAGFKPI